MKKCDACEFLKAPTNQFLVTKYWTIGINNDQPYLGRAYCTLKAHKGMIGELTVNEWQDLHSVLKKLETIYNKAFGAEVLNIECNRNNSFKIEPYDPHLHWHIYPRYKNSVEIAGLTFDDPLFGNHIDEDLVRIVDDSVVEEILAKLSAN